MARQLVLRATARRRPTSKDAGLAAGAYSWPATPAAGQKARAPAGRPSPARPGGAACALALLLTTGTLFAQASSLAAQAVPPLTGDDVVSVRVRFGITDAEPRSWNGSVEASGGGRVLAVRNWSVHPSESVDGNGWTMSTRQGMNYPRRVYQWEDPKGTVTYLHHPGVVVDVAAAGGTRLAFTTPQGDFDLRPSDLRLGEELSFLDGAVLADRVAPAQPLSSPDVENDFATMAGGEDGEVWAAWTAYRDGGVLIVARRFDGSAWQPAVTVTGEPGDRLMPKLGRDGEGRPWLIWSEQVDGNFDLYGRYLEDPANGAWSPTERLTSAPQADVEHELATDADGNLWLVWQGFRDGRSDILARRHDGSSWSAEETVSTSPANDWTPAVAACGDGSVHVAWDTYDQGNYDILLRSFADGAWSDPIPVADTPRFEAHVSLACDDRNRLWAAWNESGFQWGKDSGFEIYKEATRLYEWRTLAVAVRDGGRWQVPTADVNDLLERELPEYIPGFNDLPALQADADGRMWLFFRHRTIRARDTPDFTPAHRAAWQIFGTAYVGGEWTRPLHLPFSRGRQDVRWELAADGRGNLFAAWPTDNRDSEEYLFDHSSINAAKLPALGDEATPPRLVDPEVREYHTYPVHPNEAEDVARIRAYTIESEGRTYRIYRGDTHRHTEFSHDGLNDGSLMEAYRYALDAAELDFLGVSEHNNRGGQDIEYVNWLHPQIADIFRLPGSFVPVYTYERSIGYPSGHRNILSARRGIPTLPITEAERRHEEGAARLFAYLREHDAISIPHTSATGMGTDWRDNDPEVEPLVEIYQGDRTSAEYEGAPRAATAEKPIGQQGGFEPAGFVWNAWAKGYKLGVQAASDHISTHISYAATIAEDFTAEGLLDAMRKRHSYAATDNIVLDYRLRANGREYLQGDIVPAVSGRFELVVKVIGTARIEQIDIIRDRTFLYNRQNLDQEVDLTFVDSDVEPGEHYYYVRVIQKNREIAWSSPIWVTVE